MTAPRAPAAPSGVRRRPAVVALLALATLGLYGVVWFYRFGKEVDAAGEFGIDPARHHRQVVVLLLLVVTIPVGLLHYAVYTWRVARATQALARRFADTRAAPLRGYPLLWVPLAGVAYLAWLQQEANRTWAAVDALRAHQAERARGEEAERQRTREHERLVRCPACQHVNLIRVLAGAKTVVKCAACGFEAPYEEPPAAGSPSAR